MKCAACGGDNREGANFCRHCGAPMGVTPLPQTTGAISAAPALPESALPVKGPEAVAQAPEAGGKPALQSTADLPGGEAQQETPKAAEGAERPAPAEMPPALEELTVVPEGQETEPSVEQAQPESTLAPVQPEALKEKPAEVAEASLPSEGLAAEEAAEAKGEEQETAAAAAEPVTPLAPGTVIAGRYLLMEVSSVCQDEILYAARDLFRCWQCGFEGNAPDDAFCAQCGASMGRKPAVRLLQVRDSEAKPASGEMFVGRLDQDGLYFLLLPEAKPEPLVSPRTPSVRLVAGQRSDVGQARELNEDSLLVLTLLSTYTSETRPNMALFAVADGMGGHEGGEVASRLALRLLAERVASEILLPELAGEATPEQDLAVRLAQAVEAANDAVFLARQKRGNDMGTTLTAALVRDNRLALAHVGDSRAYRWSAAGLEQLTTDHSVVASMVAAGRARPEEIYTHPQRSVIYRSIGDQPTLQVDTATLPLAQGDRLIVCSDGLWEMVRSEGIEDVMMQEAEPQTACDLLVKRANEAGGEDNISVIVVQVGSM